MKKTLISTSIALVLSTASLSSYAEELKCNDLTLNTSLNWSACQFNKFIEEDAKELALEKATDYAKNVALDVLMTSWGFPAGLLSFFGDSNDNQLQKMTDTILDAIKVSEKNVIDSIEGMLIARDFAGLEAFKEKVRSYHADSAEVRMADQATTLQGLWDTSVELRELFRTHINTFTTYEKVESYHAYISIVALELMLRAERTTYQYQLSNQEEQIPQILKTKYQQELASVFSYIDSFDWNKTAKSFFSSVGIRNNYNPTYGYWRKVYTYTAMGQQIEIEMGVDIYSGSWTKVNKGDLTELGYVTGQYYKPQMPDGHITNIETVFNGMANDPHNPKNIYARHVNSTYEGLLKEAYQPTRPIIESWRRLASLPSKTPSSDDIYLNNMGYSAGPDQKTPIYEENITRYYSDERRIDIPYVTIDGGSLPYFATLTDPDLDGEFSLVNLGDAFKHSNITTTFYNDSGIVDIPMAAFIENGNHMTALYKAQLKRLNNGNFVIQSADPIWNAL